MARSFVIVFVLAVQPPLSSSGASITDDERLLSSEGAWHRAQRKHVDFSTSCGYTHEPELKRGCQYSASKTEAWAQDAARRLDKIALLRFFSSTGGGDTWRAADNWGEGTDPCWDNWYGVTCDEHGRVIYLELPDNGLLGSIPASLGRLTSLIKLDLSTTAPNYQSHKNMYRNALTGALPSFAACPRLEEIEVSGNRITELPDDLWRNGETLRSLSASHNLITTLPQYLMRFDIMHTLELANNLINDRFPSNAFGKLKNMRFLQLQYNNLQGNVDKDILGMTKNRVIDLSHNPNLGGELERDLLVQWPDQEYIAILNTSIGGYLSSLCLDVPFCFKFMYDTHQDLTWATVEDVPDIVKTTIALAQKNAAR